MLKNKMHEFIVYCGPMFSGKTSALLAYLDRCKYQKRSVVAFKPAIDERYSTSKIVSHGGWSIDAFSIVNATDIDKHVVNVHVDVIAVDEAFMLPGIAETLFTAYKRGSTIVVSTLDMSYSCVPFYETMRLLGYATKVEKHSSICARCGNNASYSCRLGVGSNDNSIDVGGSEKYEPRCFTCHPTLNVRL